MKNSSIFKLLLLDNNVNLYTKVLLILNSLDYYGDTYIPNRKIYNILIKYNKNVSIRQIKRIINKLEEEKIISIRYISYKRFFILHKNIIKTDDKSDNEYNWLLDYEEE